MNESVKNETKIEFSPRFKRFQEERDRIMNQMYNTDKHSEKEDINNTKERLQTLLNKQKN